jgi:hypothetical protein
MNVKVMCGRNQLPNLFGASLCAAIMTALAIPSCAQSLPNNTNFPMIGVVRGQTLQLNIVAFPPDPCIATLGFQDVNGNPLGTTLNVALQAGESAILALNGNTLTGVAGKRVQVQPTVAVVAGVTSQCNASAEVFDNLLGIDAVAVPGVSAYPPDPVFGLIGVSELQTVRVNVVAYPPVPCVGQLSFLNSQGAAVGSTLDVQLAPGQAASLDLPGSTLVTRLGQRAEVQPVVTAPNGGCVASTEVYINGLGATSVYWPPDPCTPSSCVATEAISSLARMKHDDPPLQ